MDEVKPRSDKMRKCLEKYCSNLAEALNDGGWDMRKVLDASVEIEWNQYMVKEHLWKFIQEAMTGHESSTKPSDKDYVNIYRVLDRHIAKNYGVSVDWPSVDSQQEEFFSADSHEKGKSQA